jgi:hypothetical protein
MFKKFNAGQDYINFFNIKEWKAVEKFFSYDNLSRKMSYDLKNNLPSIGISSSVIGAVLLLILFLASKDSPELAFLMYFTLVPIIAGLLIISIKYWMNALQSIFTFPFKAKFKRHMTEENLKDFVRVFSSDKYSPQRMTEKSYYNSLVLSCHHRQKDFVNIGLSILNNYHQNSVDRIRADYDKEVLARFSHEEKPIASTPVMADEKFMFMKE